MSSKEINSIKDEKIILCRELTTASGRRERKKILLLGQEQILWALNAGLSVEFVLAQKGTDFSYFPFSVSKFEVSEGILKKATETNYLISPIAVASFPHSSLNNSKPSDFVIVFDGVVDFGNIGTIVRTANSFGIHSFFATKETFDPYQRKAIDASRGSIFHSEFKEFKTPKEGILSLKKQGYQIIVTSPHAPHLQSQAPLTGKPLALVIGNESEGVSDDVMACADVCLQIPMLPSVESLNVGVAAGISIYELKFKMVLLMLKEKIFDNLGRNISVTGKLIQQAFDKRIKAVSGLSGMQVILLMIMHCDEKMERDHISRDVALFGEDLSDFLKPLQEREFVEHQNNFYLLTEKGKQFLAEVWPIVERTNEEILSDFTKEEREKMSEFLERIQKSCLEIVQ